MGHIGLISECKLQHWARQRPRRAHMSPGHSSELPCSHSDHRSSTTKRRKDRLACIILLARGESWRPITRFEGLNLPLLRLLLFSLCVDERGLRLQRHGEGADDARSADVAEDGRVGSRRYQVLDVQVSRH